MSALIRQGRLAREDYALLDDTADLPDSGGVLISLARWMASGVELQASGRPVGVRLPNTLDVETLDTRLLALPLLALEFPGFADGRAYSQARVLRSRCHYAGELRAVGAAVVLDQIEGMHRCGFDSYVLRADQDPEAVIAALASLPARTMYQPAQAPSGIVIARRRAG